jgi:hypothetical protein
MKVKTRERRMRVENGTTATTTTATAAKNRVFSSKEIVKVDWQLNFSGMWPFK